MIVHIVGHEDQLMLNASLPINNIVEIISHCDDPAEWGRHVTVNPRSFNPVEFEFEKAQPDNASCKLASAAKPDLSVCIERNGIRTVDPCGSRVHGHFADRKSGGLRFSPGDNRCER